MCKDANGRLLRFSLPTLKYPKYNGSSTRADCFWYPEEPSKSVTPENVRGVNDVYGKHSINGRKSRANHNSVHSHGSTQKINYKNLSKHLLKKLDSSCKNSPPPDIHNGKFVRFKKTPIDPGKSKSKRYMVAEFKCNQDYKFRNSHPKKMFCSKKKWVGKKPVCDKIKNTMQSDDPSAASPQYFLNSEKCSAEDQAKCKHTCRMRNDQPECDCLPGFEKDGSDCKDTDECEIDNGHCQHACTNVLGSFFCSCRKGFRLSSDQRTCEDINECHLRNGHGPCQDTCENSYGSYKCSCLNLKGTQLSADLHTCADVDECTEGVDGCSHSCVNAHGRAFCTCPDGMTLGPDWKTCQDINECDNPKIAEVCKFGCVNFIGSYYCRESSDALLSDQPIENETIPNEEEDDGDYEDEDYEDEEYEDDYKDEENYDEVEEPEKEPSQQKENKESILGRSNVHDVTSDDKKEYGKVNKENSFEPSVKEENESTFTVTPTVSVDLSKKPIVIENEDNEYEDKDYDDDDYDDEYKEDNGTNITKLNGENDPIIKENGTFLIDNTLDVNETNINVSTTLNETRKEEKGDEISNFGTDNKNSSLLPNMNKEDGNYDRNYEENMDNRNTIVEVKKNENTTAVSTTEIIKKIDDSIDDEYDDDYDDEYYDSSSKKTSTPEDDKYDKSTEDSREVTLPDVDINKVNIDIHEIIKNTTQNINININNTTEGSVTTTSKFQETTESDEDDSDDEYEYEDYEDGDYKENNKDKSKPIGKQASKCGKGYILDDNGDCADVNECQEDDNPCSDGCQNTIGSYHCTCPSGFAISPLHPHSCQDINECLDNPCSDTCVNLPGSYRCECPPGLTLQNTTCVNLTCSHGQTKINGLAQCTCPSGFVLSSDDRTCEDVDECLLDNECSDVCRNTIGSFECACNVGYELTNGTTCVDIDECKINHGCPQLCQNLPGSFNCTCEDGYGYHEKENACIDINECDMSLDLDECTQICINYEGGYECACYDGYKLGSDDATCEDVNECATNNGNCSQICTNQPGTYQCECKVGYRLGNDNETCEISDPCLIKNGGCSHQCVNENDTVVCKCPEGQVLEGKDCYKVDPCVANNGGCSHVCVNANGAIRCECPEGYELENETKCMQINPCTINNGNCSHFCEFTEGHVNCLCPNLYVLQNKTRCIEVDPCEENNGGCSHVCSFENSAVLCSCPKTHELRNATHCFDKNPCLNDNGGCSHSCHFSNDFVSCDCPENFYLEGKTCYRLDPCLKNNGGCSHECYSDDEGQVHCFCPVNFEISDDGKTCSNDNPCLIGNGNCSHICDFSSRARICSCPEGFKLKNKTHCEEFNPCSMENGGCSHKCENVEGKAKCICPENYVLTDSRNCFAIDPCQDDNGGCSHVCTEVNNEAQCSCPDHYNLVNLTTCVAVNPCLINNGGCSHECLNENGEAFCACPEGYKLHGRKCIAINPCETKNGGCSHVCTSINGQVICKCPPGHELIDKTCFKINPCSITNGGCSHGCTNVDGQAKCSCPPGYKLFGKKCSDEDPCAKNNGGCSHHCHNNEGKRECSCPTGYLLRPNKRVCKEINECKLNRGGCSHGCRNLPGSYQCTCPQGFMLDPSNNRTCVDIDECQTNNGDCQMACRNFKGGFRCECSEGYTIQKDKRTCRVGPSPMSCRVPKPPKNGAITCLDSNSDPNRAVPIGTKCNFWCNEGFQLEGSSQRVCHTSGDWEGGEPLCVDKKRKRDENHRFHTISASSASASCPSLPNIRNGWYLPGVCNSGKVFLGESCKVYCRKGYRRNVKFHKYVCGEDMQWSPSVASDDLGVACVKDVSSAYMKCPESGVLEFVLPPGERQMTVKIPRPESNVNFDRYITSYPTWGKRLQTTLPAGRSELRFTAMNPGDFSNSSASCDLTINVLDKEPPRVVGCPENIERTLSSNEEMQIVHWREPTFFDNVGVSTVYKSREPGTEFGLGLHHVSYVASDEAGNRAFCHFTIDIKDEYDLEVANSIREHSTYANHNTAGRYRAILICPSGVQYMSNSPDSYNSMLTREAGCYWKHVRVTKPMQPQSFKIPRVHSESRLPPSVRNHNRREFFRWNR